MTLKKITPFLAALFLVACGDDSSSSATPAKETDVVVETFEELNVCTDKREGSVAYVKDEKVAYTCENGEWVKDSAPESSSAGKTEKVSSSSESEKLSSSSEKSKEKSSSSEAVESSSSEKPASSSSVEKQEESSSSETPESSSSEPEPRKMANIDVRTFQYEANGMDAILLSVANKEDHDLDSLTIYVFFTGKPEEVEKCGLLMDSYAWQIVNLDGGNVSDIPGKEITYSMRDAHPVRIDDSYDSVAKTYSYFYPINLGSTKLASQSRFSMEIEFSSGISNDSYHTCDILRQPSKKRFSKDSNDWSWMPHTLADGAEYVGMPLKESSSIGLIEEDTPLNPYILVFRKDYKDGYLWGYAPFAF